MIPQRGETSGELSEDGGWIVSTPKGHQKMSLILAKAPVLSAACTITRWGGRGA